MNPLRRNEKGFTLIEMLVALLIFSSVMFTSYEILDITLRAERTISEATLYGEIGQAVLTQMRRDLQGALFEGMGRRVFRGDDRGDGETAEDSMHFLTTAPVPMPPEDFRDVWDGEIASVGYVLKRDGDLSVLFRRVNWNLDEPQLGEEGSYFPIYDKVKSLSLRYFDGIDWFDSWNSEDFIPEETEEPDEDGAADPPPSDPPPSPPADPANPDPDAIDEPEQQKLPIPRAVEIILSINIGDEKGLILDADGQPLLERYSLIVPLIVTDRLDLEVETPDLPIPGNR